MAKVEMVTSMVHHLAMTGVGKILFQTGKVRLK
jgi:hypothetical protein